MGNPPSKNCRLCAWTLQGASKLPIKWNNADSNDLELIVLKNNQPSAIILSPEEYTRLTEIEEDYFLLLEANKRMEENGNHKTISFHSVMSDLGIHEDELLEAEDVDIE